MKCNLQFLMYNTEVADKFAEKIESTQRGASPIFLQEDALHS
jgi:hypothetical protein